MKRYGWALAVVLAVGGCGDSPTAVDPADFVGVWRSTGPVSVNTYQASLRVRISEASASDVSGSWSWGLTYGGGIVAGGVKDGTVSATLRDYDTLADYAFSGEVDGDTLAGTFIGIAVTMERR